MFHRAYNNSSSRRKEDNSVNKIWKLLIENGYSEGLLRRLLREVQRSRARRGRDKGRVREGGKDAVDGFLTLPYIDEKLLRKVKHIVGKSKFQVHIAWKNENKLKNTLIRSSICKPTCPGGRKCHLCMTDFQGDCTQKNTVYLINCKLCRDRGKEISYVGESMRPVRLRFNEHRRDAINRTPNTPFGYHFGSEHRNDKISASSNILDMKILYRAQDHPDRKIAESIYIRRKTPFLNIQGSSWPIMRVP